MRLLPILTALTVLILVTAGGCRHPRPQHSPSRYKDGLTTQAYMMLDTGAAFEEYFPVQEEAVRRLRAGTSQEDPVAVLEQMAYFLFSAGRLDEALPYFNEALDSLHAQPGAAASECAIQLYGDVSQFYDRIGMSEKAIEYSDSSMAVSRRLGGRLMPDILRFRAQVYANDGNTAEAFRCLDSAYAAARRGGPGIDTALMAAVTAADRANIILSRSTSRDSVDLAVALLKPSLKADDGHELTEYMGPLGYGLYLQGNKEEGISMMESALEKIRGFGDLELTFLEMRRLIEVYNAEKMFDKVSVIYKEYTLLGDSMDRARHNMDLMSAKVRADVAAKERENRQLQKKLQTRHRQILTAITLSAVLALTALLLFFLGRRHSLKMKALRDAERARRLTAEADTSEAITERDSALRRIEAIKTEIADRGAAEATDILRHPQSFGDNSGAFLRAFNAMYPRFADELRRDYPSLTDTDMVFCMLIYLKHSTKEIAAYLNISHASVNTARYRIRSKLGLNKGDNLDLFLQSREG